jgi:hypothetical protein
MLLIRPPTQKKKPGASLCPNSILGQNLRQVFVSEKAKPAWNIMFQAGLILSEMIILFSVFRGK